VVGRELGRQDVIARRQHEVAGGVSPRAIPGGDTRDAHRFGVAEHARQREHAQTLVREPVEWGSIPVTGVADAEVVGMDERLDATRLPRHDASISAVAVVAGSERDDVRDDHDRSARGDSTDVATGIDKH
jgi:hypothetical protein